MIIEELIDTGKVKPIPKYMLRLLKREDKREYPTPTGRTRFLAYLAIWKKELVKVTVAIKEHKGTWYCKQVAIHGLNSEKCLIKDIEYNGYYGMGYSVSWYNEGLTKHKKWWDSIDWYYAPDKAYDPYARIVNRELIGTIPEFKYSQYDKYPMNETLPYLRLYRQHPEIEYFMKLDLVSLVSSKMILNKAIKDKQFCKWIYRNANILKSNCYYVRAILRAYQNGTDIHDEQLREKIMIDAKGGEYYNFRQHYIYDFEKLVDYVIEQKTNMSSYMDYFHACEYLCLDMGQEKNRMPHDFACWHDIRMDEYRTQKALEDEQKRATMYASFKDIAKKYEGLEYNKKTDYRVIIARSPNDLVYEGEQLHHCVGKMNYDQKFIREETLIFFIRTKDEPNTPLVTLEYDISSHRILQCYAEHDSQPSEDIKQYVHKVWLPYANRQIKKIQQLSA